MALLWRGAAGQALELATAEIGDATLRARGAWVRSEPEPYSLSYELETAAGFVTTSLAVSAWGAGWSRSLDLRRRQDGSWVADPGGELTGLEEALDCDLGYSCLTNTMPVLRHRLLDGGQVELVMAWISVPDLRPGAATALYASHTAAGGRGRRALPVRLVQSRHHVRRRRLRGRIPSAGPPRSLMAAPILYWHHGDEDSRIPAGYLC